MGRGSSKAGGGAATGVSTAESKPMTIKEMISKGMTPAEIKSYREANGLYTENVRKLDGVRGAVATTWTDVQNSSPNTLWTEGNVHAVLSNDKGTVQVKGDKKDKFAILNSVNTAVVHIKTVSSAPTKRDISTVNKQIQEIKSMGFDTPKIATNLSGETIVYAKRHRFTKNF